MITRKINVEQRLGINQVLEYHVEYRIDDSGDIVAMADFELQTMIDASGVAQGTWDAIVQAIQDYGDAQCGGYVAGAMRVFRVESNVNGRFCTYRLARQSGSPIIRNFDLTDVMTAYAATITAQQWTDVITAMQVYGDTASGYAP